MLLTQVKLQIVSSFFFYFSGNLITFLYLVEYDAKTVGVAAWKLHEAMWQQDLGNILQDIEGFKYLPTTEVERLQLQELGCNADIILIHSDYIFTMNILKQCYQKKSGGIVVMGTGIGTHQLQKVHTVYS